jgi:Fic family protein
MNCGERSFWDVHAAFTLNERQRKIVTQLLNGFEGKLTSSKWAKLAKCSQDEALRNIEDLVRKGNTAEGPGWGRSMSYSLREAAADRQKKQPAPDKARRGQGG